MRELDLSGARVLLRADYDIEVYEYQVLDDRRLGASVETLQALRSAGARIAICAHRGRPEGVERTELSMQPLALRLSGLLGAPVATATDCVGPAAEAAAEALEPGGVLLLENVQFHRGETDNDPVFAAGLARLGDVFVNDAFAAMYQEHASIVGVPKLLPSAAGLLVEAELDALDPVITDPARPLGLVLGGVQVERKLLLVEHLLPRLDVLCVGGLVGVAMLRAAGLRIAGMEVDERTVQRVERILDDIRSRPQFRLVLPGTVVASDGFNAFAMSPAQLPPDWVVMDTGASTVRAFEEALRGCRTVIWNGTLGAFRRQPFDYATLEMAELLSNMSAHTVAAGGETASAIRNAGRWDEFTHVSTGGATALRLLAGVEVPGLQALTAVQRDTSGLRPE
jgi:phosphoglycerate kinase